MGLQDLFQQFGVRIPPALIAVESTTVTTNAVSTAVATSAAAATSTTTSSASASSASVQIAPNPQQKLVQTDSKKYKRTKVGRTCRLCNKRAIKPTHEHYQGHVYCHEKANQTYAEWRQQFDKQ
jgi:hypothetical protein